MGKFAKTSAVVLAAASALFLFAPTFQQGLKLTTQSWRTWDAWPSWIATVQHMGQEAEARHDAQTLAFAAMQLGLNLDYRAERDRFADEAVQLDPRLTWIYCDLLGHGYVTPERRDPNDARWLARLEAWAPDNAAIYGFEASLHRPRKVTGGLNPQFDRPLLAGSPRWLSAMDKAFSATNYDSYLSQRMELDRNVARRVGVVQPGQMLWPMFAMGIIASGDFGFYADDFLLKSGADFEAKGDLKRAEENYTKVARVAELIQLGGDSDQESFVASNLQLAVDPKLQALYEKDGNSAAANLIAYQLAVAQHTKSQLMAKSRQFNWSSNLQLFDASVVQVSLLTMIISLLMIVSCGVYLVLRRLRSAKSARWMPVFSRAGVCGAILLFISSTIMYFGYVPYADAFKSYLTAPNPRDARDLLLRFWGLENTPSSWISWFWYHPVKVYFWYAVIVIGCAAILWIVLRRVVRRLHPPRPIRPVA